MIAYNFFSKFFTEFNQIFNHDSFNLKNNPTSFVKLIFKNRQFNFKKSFIIKLKLKQYLKKKKKSIA